MLRLRHSKCYLVRETDEGSVIRNVRGIGLSRRAEQDRCDQQNGRKSEGCKQSPTCRCGLRRNELSVALLESDAMGLRRSPNQGLRRGWPPVLVHTACMHGRWGLVQMLDQRNFARHREDNLRFRLADLDDLVRAQLLNPVDNRLRQVFR